MQKRQVAAPRKHHFIPAFYLKQWAAPDGKLIEWSKPFKDVRPIRRHPNATAFQNGLYTFQDLLPEACQLFEQMFLQSTDDLASQALTRIMNGQIHTLNDLRKSGWARFLMTLQFRHPDVVPEIRDAIAVLWADHDRFTNTQYGLSRSPDDPPTFDEYLAKLSPDGQTGGVSPNPRKFRRGSIRQELSLQRAFSGKFAVTADAKSRL